MHRISGKLLVSACLQESHRINRAPEQLARTPMLAILSQSQTAL
jgi:hypothetical protein